MSVDKLIVGLIWTVGGLAFLIATPKNRHRRMIFAFLTCQTLNWVTSLIQVDLHLYSFPVREFPKATNLLLALDYFFNPILCAFYIIYEPKGPLRTRIFWLCGWITGLVTIDTILEKNTNLVHYIHYRWYTTWLYFFILFVLTNAIYRWFFKSKALLHADREAAQ